MKKILLIDDSEVSLAKTKNILKNKYDILTANSGFAAITHLSKGYVPDLILLDVLMPEMDGWEAYNLIKGICLLRDVPIAFFTSLDNETDKTQASRLGAADFISKPLENDELIQRIESIICKFESKSA